MNETPTTNPNSTSAASQTTGASTAASQPVNPNAVVHDEAMNSATASNPEKPAPSSPSNASLSPSNSTSAKKSKRLWIFAGVGVLAILLIIGGIFAATQLLGGKPQPSPTPAPKKRIVGPLNVIPQAERPYVLLSPESDGHNISLWVMSLNKPANSVEYEMEYQAGELLQGVMGSLKLDTLPAKTTQLMGSCSAGGKCSYHENVKGGQLILHFVGEDDARYGLKQEWKYIDNKAKETAFSSKDGMFQLTSPDLKTHRYIVIYNSPGAPASASGALASEVYALQSSSPLKGKGELTLRASEEKPNLAIAGYDGTEWKVFKSKTDGKMVTATVDLMPTYVVVEQL